MRGIGIAAKQRLTEDAFVYIAASRTLELIKIGWSKGSNQTNRMKSLNKDGYGGSSDWLLLYERKFRNSGWVEIEAHNFLRAFKVRDNYLRLGHSERVTTREAFCCNYADALEAIERTKHEPLERRYERHDARIGYNYRLLAP
jgi:hypothetical protein